MKRKRNPQPILEADIKAKPIERRTFLGRFGVAAGILGTAGCWGYVRDMETSGSMVCDGDSRGDPKATIAGLSNDTDSRDVKNTTDNDRGDQCRFAPAAPEPAGATGACDSDRGDRKTQDADPTDPAASTDSDAGDPCP